MRGRRGMQGELPLLAARPLRARLPSFWEKMSVLTISSVQPRSPQREKTALSLGPILQQGTQKQQAPGPRLLDRIPAPSGASRSLRPQGQGGDLKSVPCRTSSDPCSPICTVKQSNHVISKGLRVLLDCEGSLLISSSSGIIIMGLMHRLLPGYKAVLIVLEQTLLYFANRETEAQRGGAASLYNL